MISSDLINSWSIYYLAVSSNFPCRLIVLLIIKKSYNYDKKKKNPGYKYITMINHYLCETCTCIFPNPSLDSCSYLITIFRHQIIHFCIYYFMYTCVIYFPPSGKGCEGVFYLNIYINSSFCLCKMCMSVNEAPESS